MNVFEDLIEELKEEKLLEKTVIDTRNKRHHNKKKSAAAEVAEETVEPAIQTEGQADDPNLSTTEQESEEQIATAFSEDASEEVIDECASQADDQSISIANAEELSDDVHETEYLPEPSDESDEDDEASALAAGESPESIKESVSESTTDEQITEASEDAVTENELPAELSEPEESISDQHSYEETEDKQDVEESLVAEGDLAPVVAEIDHESELESEDDGAESDEEAFSHQQIIADEDEESLSETSEVEDEGFSHMRLLEEMGEHENTPEPDIDDTSQSETFEADNVNNLADTVNNNESDGNQGQSLVESDSASNSDPDDSLSETGFVIDEPAKDKPAKDRKRERAPINQAEYLRRRAVEEFNSLQMVEHIISGTEREQLKVIPSSYNDIAVSKALHDFLKISKDAEPQKSAEAEFQLMEETQAWHFALSERDTAILPAQLRRYCETTRPALSSQALAALGRFYRNAPFSESVRSKFEIIMTRFFSKEIEGEKREAILPKDEIARNLGDLYADWSSIPYYEDDENSDVLLNVLKFDDFVEEVKNAEDFEELIRNDFFERLREFKESIGENFYSPLVIAAVVNSNIAIGNKYVEMMAAERDRNSLAELEEKYSQLFEGQVSDSASKTMRVVELLNKKVTDPIPVVKPEVKKPEPVKPKHNRGVIVSPGSDNREKRDKTSSKSKKSGKSKSPLAKYFKVSKWSLVALILTIVLMGGLYAYVEFFVEQPISTENVKKVNLETSSLKEYLKTARISEDTFYGITLPSWDTLSVERREEVLRKVMSIGDEKGYKKVVFLTGKGEMISFATKDKVVADVKKQGSS